MKLIGLTGRAGCGKDTVARFLCETQGFVQIALADPLRDGLKAMLGLTDEQLHRRDLKELPIGWLGRSPRALLQTLGTEWGRAHVAPDIWLRAATRRIEQLKAAPPCLHVAGIVVSDIRFDNEADWLRAQGGELWHIEGRRSARPRATCRCGGLCDSGHPCPMGEPAHASEQGVRHRAGEPIIHNTGTLDALFEQVAELLEHRRPA